MSVELTIFFAMIVLVGFVLSALYSGLETGVYVLNPVRLRLRESRGDRAAGRVKHELTRPSRLLAVLLIGTNAANYLGSYGLAELLGGAGLDDWSLIVVQIVVFTPLLFIFAENLPKELFRVRADRWLYHLIPFITLSRVILTAVGLLPLVDGISRVVSRLVGRTEQDAASARSHMSQLLKEGIGTGVLSVAQTTLADRVLALREQNVQTVMVPWREAWTVQIDAPTDERTSRIAGRHYTRLPVVNSAGHVVGIITWIDALLERDQPTSTLMQEPLFVHPRTRLAEAVTQMRHERRTMAVVQDEDGAPLGLITLKDLVEPLTGELAGW